MTAPALKLTFDRRAWRVPSEDRALERWLEGRLTEAQRDAAVARAKHERTTWTPDADAWDQMLQLQQFVGQQVRVHFWDTVMYLLDDDDWPRPVEARCEGIITLIDDGHLQPFLLLADPAEVNTGGSSGLGYLVEHRAINCTLAPVAEVYEVEAVAEPA